MGLVVPPDPPPPCGGAGRHPCEGSRGTPEPRVTMRSGCVPRPANELGPPGGRSATESRSGPGGATSRRGNALRRRIARGGTTAPRPVGGKSPRPEGFGECCGRYVRPRPMGPAPSARMQQRESGAAERASPAGPYGRRIGRPDPAPPRAQAPAGARRGLRPARLRTVSQDRCFALPIRESRHRSRRLPGAWPALPRSRSGPHVAARPEVPQPFRAADSVAPRLSRSPARA